MAFKSVFEKVRKFQGLSTDTKPSLRVADSGAVFYELDTGKLYVGHYISHNNTLWYEKTTSELAGLQEAFASVLEDVVELRQLNSFYENVEAVEAVDDAFILDLDIARNFEIEIALVDDETGKAISFDNIPETLEFTQPVTVKIINTDALTITYPEGTMWATDAPTLEEGDTAYIIFRKAEGGWHAKTEDIYPAPVVEG